MEVAEFAVVMFFVHGTITIPIAIAAGYVGWSGPRWPDVFVLIALGVILFTLMPVVPGAATGSAGMVYLVLPTFVPWYILFPYVVGMALKKLPRWP